MAQEIHIGDVGTLYIATIKDGSSIVDISSATDLKLVFKRPDGSVQEKTGSLFTDGTDGKVYYRAQSGFHDQVGDWEVQGQATIGEWSGRSDVHEFTVHEILE